MNNTSLVKINDFKNLLNDKSVMAQIQNSWGKDNAGAFRASVLDLYSTETGLQNCDPKAVLVEVLKACALKLPIVKNLGFAYVVPFKNKPTFTIGYKGLIQLAQRTGQYKFINADIIYEGMLIDKKEFRLTGELDITGDIISDNITGYFAYIELHNGFQKAFYMPIEKVQKYGKKYSPSYGSNFSPWVNEFDKMAMKTCLRQLISVYGVMSSEMQTILNTEFKRETEMIGSGDEVVNPFTETDSRQQDIEDNVAE